MTIDEIKELIQVVNVSGIAELEVQRGDNRVRIRRSIVQTTQEIVMASPVQAGVPTYLPQSNAQTPSGFISPTAAGVPSLSAKEAETENVSHVKSPIVGTYYDAPSPGSPPFVKIGDRVAPGQTLCIIESMKLMNEIECEVTGMVVSKLVENGQPVEYGESLFTVKPL